MLKEIKKSLSSEKGGRLWITWNTQRRNETLSDALGASFVEFKSSASNFIRYPYLSFKTLLLLNDFRPNLIFAQNPSLFLAGLVSFVGKLFKIPVIIDAHNAGIYPLEGRSNLLNYVALKINSLADIVIVSNDNLREYLGHAGIVSFSIPDPIPVIKSSCPFKLDKSKFNVVFVCSWASDEPYDNVIKAAALLDDSVCIYITGDGEPLNSGSTGITRKNIVFTGFLSDKEYESLLCSCDTVMVLTTRDDCLVCGAYEGISVDKPLILSNTKALREYFNLGVTYTGNGSEDIAESIYRAKTDMNNLKEEVVVLRKARNAELRLKLDCFNEHLDTLIN